MATNDAPVAWRDLVVFNAAFRVHLAGRAPDVGAGVELTREALAGGRARELLERWRARA